MSALFILKLKAGENVHQYSATFNDFKDLRDQMCRRYPVMESIPFPQPCKPFYTVLNRNSVDHVRSQLEQFMTILVRRLLFLPESHALVRRSMNDWIACLEDVHPIFSRRE